MPMYYPDLKSVKDLAEMCVKHQPKDKIYKGLVPKTEADLPKARKELGKYFREVWHDEIQALEVELAVTRENYHEKLGAAIRKRF
jgi:hypothetical protein